MKNTHFYHKDAEGYTHDIYDVSKCPLWSDVLCVEQIRNRENKLTTVINHREKNFTQRKLELKGL